MRNDLKTCLLVILLSTNVFLFMLPVKAESTIGLEDTASGAFEGVDTGYVSLTVTEANLLVVAVLARCIQGYPLNYVNWVRWGTQSFTSVRSRWSADGTLGFLTLGYVVNPSMGTKNVEVKLAQTDTWIVIAYAMTNARWFSYGDGATFTSESSSVSSWEGYLLDGSWLLSYCGTKKQPIYTPTSDQTVIETNIAGSGAPTNTIKFQGCYEPKDTEGIMYANWDLSASCVWVAVVMEIKLEVAEKPFVVWLGLFFFVGVVMVVFWVGLKRK